MKNEATNGPQPHHDNDVILKIGHLMLRLEQLHKLGLRALQLASLVYHMTELISHSPNNLEGNFKLINYCKTDGVRCVLVAQNVMLLMQACIEEIRDYYKSSKILPDKDVVDAAAETAEFVSDLYGVLDVAIKRIADMLTEAPKLRKSADHSEFSGEFNSTAIRAAEVGGKSLMDLEEAVADFGLTCGNITEWIKKSTVSTHEGGRLKIYWPPNL